MIDGILLINKEVGITSYDVLRRLKRIFPKGQKMGHAGTLDPFATGLLIVLLGKHTKLMPKILEMEKEYIVKAEFGYATDTQDVTGKKVLISEENLSIEKKNIEKGIKEGFVGEVSQIPPLFSAKKVKGRKAYEYAREKKDVVLDEKVVNIEEYSIVEYDWPYVKFKIVCSSGTYIRTLVNDLGHVLGSYATAVELERVRIGKFDLEDSLCSKDIENMSIEKFNLLKNVL
jgi:tRNA pseudouridine55 synthase